MNRVPAIRFGGFTDPWEQRKALHLASYSKGKGYSKDDLTESGTPVILYGRLYTKYESVIEEVDTFVDASNDGIYSHGDEVIVPASGETAEDIARASAVAQPGVLFGGDLNILRPNKSITSLFMALSLSNGTAQKELSKRAQGKSVVHVHNSDIQDVTISYPTIDEQTQIGAFFRSLDSLITLHQRKYDKLRTMKKSMLDKMFPKPGEFFPEIRFEGFTDPWEQRKLGEIVDVCGGKDYKHLKPGSIPVYGTGGLMTYVDEALSKNEDAIGIGRKGTIDRPYKLHAPFWTVDTLFYAVPRTNIDIEFALSCFLRINWKAKDESTGLPSLSKNAISDTQLLIPDAREQHQIGALFRNLDSLITLHQRKLELLKNVKKSLLDKMFV